MDTSDRSDKRKRLSEKSQFQFVNKTKGSTLAGNARVAISFFKRAKGLLGTDSLTRGEGLFISPCNSIHMIGMKYAIDAVFVDKQFNVVGVIHSIKPGRISKVYGKAWSCLELPAGVAQETRTESGDTLEMIELRRL